MYDRLPVVCWLSLCLWLASAAKADDFLAEESADPPPAASCDACPGTACACEAGPCCCDSCGCSQCWDDSCCNGLAGPRLFGFLPSDHCFDDFISPISNPFFFEDPRSLTEARGIFIDNSLPRFLGGGDAQVWAAQLRGRLTDRFSVIAPRLSYFQVNEAGGGAPYGFLSAPVGGKLNLIRDVERQFIVSAGITYFIPGSATAYANFGSGDFHFFLTAGKRIFDNGHWLSGTGFRIPANGNIGTQLFYWSNQWDYRLPNNIYPLFGINWFHWMRSSPLDIGAPIAALDFLNLPISGVAGKNVVTGVVGFKWKPSGHYEFGTGFEFPLTARTDILKNRLYVDMIFRYSARGRDRIGDYPRLDSNQ